MKKAFFYLVIFLMIQFFASYLFTLVAMLIDMSAQSTPMLIAASLLSSVVAVALFVWRKWTPVGRAFMKSRPWAVLTWSAVAALGAIVPSMWLSDVLPELPNVVSEELEGIMRNRWGYFALGLGAPIAEEFVFRGAMLRSLLDWGEQKHLSHWWPIAISAVLFSVAHFNPAQMVHAFLIGLLLGWMYYRTGSIIPGIVYHWVNNTVAYVMENLMPGTEHLSDLFGDNLVRIGMSVLFSLFILVPALYQLHLNMKAPLSSPPGGEPCA